MNQAARSLGRVCLYTTLVVGFAACSDAGSAGAEFGPVPPDTATGTTSLDTGIPEASSPGKGGPVPGPWVTIPAGTFTMGSPKNELCRETDEEQHQVTLTHRFEIQSTEVTQGEFQALMGYNPSWFGPNGMGDSCGKNCPVEGTNWHQAVAYCNALSLQKGHAQCFTCTGSKEKVRCAETENFEGGKIYTCPGYRLPTEAEWEYAYRAGTQTALYNGPILLCKYNDPNADKIGWFTHNSGGKTHPVAQKQANAWHLYDMAGNVFEWCHDWYYDLIGSSSVIDPWGSSYKDTRVVRGGAWVYSADPMRAASRGGLRPTTPYKDIGFRCVRTK